MPGYTLPYRTDWQDMFGVLDYAKGRGGAERAALDARFGAGETMRETLNALEQIGLAARDDSGGVRVTELGDRLAYAPSDRDRLNVLIEAICGYPPYRVPLERALADDLEVVDAPWVEHVWQVDMRLGQPRNRVAEARTFFFRLADEAGLGAYRRGVRGQTTRLELASEFGDLVGPVLRHREETQSGVEPQPVEHSPRADAVQIQDLPTGVGVASGPTDASTAPAISITVDLTDWDLDRIEAFLRMIGYPIVE